MRGLGPNLTEKYLVLPNRHIHYLLERVNFMLQQGLNVADGPISW